MALEVLNFKSKPEPGKDVTVVQLGFRISIRIWHGDLACIQSFAFDFVNGRGQHIRIQKDCQLNWPCAHKFRLSVREG